MRSPYCGCQASLQSLCISPAHPDHLSSPLPHIPPEQQPRTLLAKVRGIGQRSYLPHYIAFTCALCCFLFVSSLLLPRLYLSALMWVLTFSSFMLGLTSILLAGESKAKPRTFISTPASVSLAVKNNQGVQAGQGCMQPGAWRGCKKSAW